ncbi:MAG: signal recognition particle-docking protein FtsY [Candidatus Bipolaricaulota bacterium]|nr:MAG: signal recognition particle-docking protein FtsY [Candidatus Bipolaricaulota bacterium]
MSSWRDRLRGGLAKSRSGLVEGVAALIRGGARGEEETREALEELLLAADVGPVAATEIAARLARASQRSDAEEALRDELVTRLDGCERALDLRTDGEPTIFLMAGVNGSGKTTTIAKLAAHLRAEEADLSLTFAAADTFRAAAAEQLAVWADRLDADLVRQRPGADPAAVVFDAIAHARRVGGALFVDTAGRLQTRSDLMEELRKIERTVHKRAGRGSDERLLVLDATTGQNGVRQAERFHEAIDLTGIVLTKLDGTSKGGVVLSIWEALRVPLAWIGVGEGMDDMHPFRATEFVEALIS